MIRDPDILEALLDSVRRFVRERLVPAENEVAETDEIPESIVQEMRELGLFGTWATVVLPDYDNVLHHYPLTIGEYAISTSNRNFEGRQGAGGRTPLVSPAMAVAAAVEGHFIDIRHWS